VFDMLQQFDRPEITSNAEFQQQGAVLNELLFAEEVAAPGSQDSAQELNATKEVQVRVRRAGDSVTSEEVYVTVASTASMRDVRAAVAEKCNNPAFLQRAKLVRNRGGVLVGYQDSEPIRGRRRLLFLGPSLWRDGDVGDEAPSAGDSDSEEADGAAPGTLSLEKARRFLHRVKDACASQSFQQSVSELRARARQRGETTGTRMAVGTLFIAACQSILRKFGFGIDRQGYEQMFTAIFPHGQDPTILALASDIEKLLGVPVGSWFGLSNDGIQDGSGQLSRDEARQVVTEIRRLVGSPTFQKEVVAIRDGVRSRSGSLQEVSQEVYMPFYRLVRPITLAFRLGGDPQCLSRMSAALAPHMEDAQLRSAVRQVETSFLHTHPGAFFATSQDAPQGSLEATVKIRIRHAVSGAEVPLTVPASSTMGDIREALAKAVESEEVWRNGRLVESRRGGAFTSFKDGEKLQKRRRLLFLGADLPTKQMNGAAKVKLSRQQAVDLQNELLEGFRSGDFQERFRELQAKFPDGGATFYVERRKLVLSVQTKVIPKYGFAADLSGVFDMVRLLGTLPDEENEIGRRGWEIERLIGERETSHENAQAKDVDAGIDTEASDEVLDVQPAPDTDAENSARGENQFMNALDEMEDEGMMSEQALPVCRTAEGVLAESDGHDSFASEKQAVQEAVVKLAGESAVDEAGKTTQAEPDVAETPSLDQLPPASAGQEAEQTAMPSTTDDAADAELVVGDASAAQGEDMITEQVETTSVAEAVAEDPDQETAAPETAAHSTDDAADAELVVGEASAVDGEDMIAARAETTAVADDPSLDQQTATPETAVHSATDDTADAELVVGEASAVQEEDVNAAQAGTRTETVAEGSSFPVSSGGQETTDPAAHPHPLTDGAADAGSFAGECTVGSNVDTFATRVGKASSNGVREELQDTSQRDSVVSSMAVNLEADAAESSLHLEAPEASPSAPVEAEERRELEVDDVAGIPEDEEGQEESEEEEEQEEEEEEELDEDWDEAARIVDETSAQIQEVLAATRTASKKEKPALLARKRELETGAEYLDALAYLEDPVGERRRRQEADAEASRIVDEVAGKIAEVLISMRTASKKDKPVLLAQKRELENGPEYLNALQYLEDPAKERQCRRQSAQ